jgi:hypothetical protein
VQQTAENATLGAIAELSQPPTVESARLFKAAAQLRNLSADDLALARAAREEVKQHACRIAALIDTVEGLSLTADECSVLQPPYGRATHLPSPDRPYVHLAVHSGQGAVSVTPVWAVTIGGNVVMSTVENRIKARATALDPMVALSVSAGIGSPRFYEIGAFLKQSQDSERKLIRTLAETYSTPKTGEQTDGNYTSWELRERNGRLQLEARAYYIRNELSDEPVSRSAPYVQSLAPRYSNANLAKSSGRRSHDSFWGQTSRSHGEARDELAILGMARRAQENNYRSLSPTYGHLACFDHHGLLRCRQIGFDVIDVRLEGRISFLVDKRDCDSLLRNPTAAMSVAKYHGGSVWLQSRGLIQLHDDPGMVRASIRRLESRYNRVHQRLALDVSSRGRNPENYVLATLSHQRLSSRFREDERSLRSAPTRTGV